VQRDAVHLLQLLNLSDYADCLVRQGYVSLQSILDVNCEDLEDIGISKLGTSPLTGQTGDFAAPGQKQ